MKTALKLTFFAAGICFIFACTKSDEKLIIDDPEGSHLKSGRSGEVWVTVPFKADFLGTYVGYYPDETCELPQVMRIEVDFEGTGTHLGNFTGSFSFCTDAESYYGPTESHMVAANGDILYVSCWGQVIQGKEDDHPDHVTSYWRDPFVISGGTGRFKDAYGEGRTDDYNSSLDANSHHHWRGTITMKKGKR
jgi:hypothetical protein